MVKDDLYITAPSFFRCPISLDVMKSPVSLCTGVTYDRSSIQRWLDGGNNTCPATMQVLQTKDFVPNCTLQRLIQIWTQSNSPQTQSNSPTLTQEKAQSLIQQLNFNPNNYYENQSFFETILKLTLFAKESDDTRRFLSSKHEFLTILTQILGDQSMAAKNIRLAEKIIQLCHMVFNECVDKERLAKLVVERNCLVSMEILLQKGISLESRIASAKILEVIAVDVEKKILISGRDEILSSLLELVKSEFPNPDGIEAGLSCLVCISMPKQTRTKLVRLGTANVLGKILTDSDLSVSIIEKTLKLLAMVCSCTEGRDSVCRDELCVPAIVQKVMKVSNFATEQAVTILWSLCCLFRDHKAQEAVIRSNGLTKVLLLMQSNCSPAVRQMSGELLKIFKVNSKCFLSSYDTKTSHIMPF